MRNDGTYLAQLLQEQHRPHPMYMRQQYHFMGDPGWINDPNGLVCYKDAYHFFYQYNPFGLTWGCLLYTSSHKSRCRIFHCGDKKLVLMHDKISLLKPHALIAVSYTHLDVYKRQAFPIVSRIAVLPDFS